MPFVQQTTPRIHFGLGALQKLGEELKQFPEGAVLIVTDPGVLKAGIAAPALNPLCQAMANSQSAVLPTALDCFWLLGKSFWRAERMSDSGS